MILFLRSLLWAGILSSTLMGASPKKDTKTQLEQRLLLRSPERGLISEEEILDLDLSPSQSRLAVHRRNTFAQKLPIGQLEKVWIDRFHRDLYRALLYQSPDKPKRHQAIESNVSVQGGHQSQVFQRKDGLPRDSGESSPLLRADVSLRFKGRALPKVGELQVEIQAQRQDFERSVVQAYDSQTLGTILSIENNSGLFQFNLENQYYGQSASRLGATQWSLSWRRQEELISSILDGKVEAEAEVSFKDFRKLESIDPGGNNRDQRFIRIKGSFFARPQKLFNGESTLSLGLEGKRAFSKSQELDALELTPSFHLVWQEKEQIYFVQTLLQYSKKFKHRDLIGERDDGQLQWKTSISRRLSSTWSLTAGTEVILLDSKQGQYSLQNESLFLGLACLW